MKPEIESRPGGYRFAWGTPPIVIEVRRLHDQRGTTHGEITISANGAGPTGHLHQAGFNFSSTQTRDKLARYMEDRYSEADWGTLLEQLCHHTLRLCRQGEPPVTITSDENPGPLKYLIEPLLPLGQSAVIFGDGGSLKSTIAQLLCIVALLPWERNPLGLVPPTQSTPALYLDWEANEDEFRWRYHALGHGLKYSEGEKLPMTQIVYRRMSRPLAEDIEVVQEMVADYSIGLLVIDSLGAASGGDLNNSEPATRLYGALRQVRTTNLILAHTSKDQLTKRKTIYGNIHFSNYARSVWEARKSQEEESSAADLALFHRKWNRKSFRPLGYHMEFADDSLAVSSAAIKDMDELREMLSLGTRIQVALRDGPMPVKDLAAALDVPNNQTLATELQRMKTKGRLVKLPEGWALAAHV